MANIVILGGGFAAVSAAETLASAVGEEHAIILISKNSDLTFFPAIVPMVFGDFAPEDMRFDLRPKLAERNIHFIQGEVRAINTHARTVNVGRAGVDAVINFDYLIIAMGRRLAMVEVPGLSEHAHDLLSIPGALKFKEAIAAFESGSIVLGLCPNAALPVPVCESALALAKRFESEMKHGTVAVNVVFPTTLERAFSGSTLFRDIENEFDRKGIRLVSDFAVSHVSERQIFSALGSSLHYDLLMLIPPMASQTAFRSTGLVTGKSESLKVNDLMQVGGADGVYAAGDIVSIPGPRFGYMAIRQGRVAAANIIAELSGEDPHIEYVHKIEWAIAEQYTDPVFFHYGFWDETLPDLDGNALFGMVGKMRDRYGPVKPPEGDNYSAAA